MSEATGVQSTCENTVEISTLPQHRQATTVQQPTHDTVSTPHRSALHRHKQFRRSTTHRVVHRPSRLPQSTRIRLQTRPVQSQPVPKPKYFHRTRKMIIAGCSIALTAGGMIVGAVLGHEGNVLNRRANELSEKSLKLAVWTAKKELREYCERARVSPIRGVRR